MGALLIVGVLYSIRMIHRKRRNSFKHQRRKVRQPEVSHSLSVCLSVRHVLPGSGVNLPLLFPHPATPRAGDEPSRPGHAFGWQFRGRVLKRRDIGPGQTLTQNLGDSLHTGQFFPLLPSSLQLKINVTPHPHRSASQEFYRVIVMHCHWTKKYLLWRNIKIMGVFLGDKMQMYRFSAL